MALNAHYENFEFDDGGPKTVACGNVPGTSVRVVRFDGGINLNWPVLSVSVSWTQSGSIICDYALRSMTDSIEGDGRNLSDLQADACVQDIRRLMSQLDDCP